MKLKTIIKVPIFIFFLILTGIYISCNNPAGPGETPPGSRNYKWTADTLKGFPDHVEITRIWGASSNDVWATAFSTSVKNRIWHYDGMQWKRIIVYNNAEPNALWGFSSSNIWMANWLGVIWHYDGTQWNLYKSYKIEGYQEMVFNCIFGDSPNNIYLVGSAMRNGSENLAVIMHYDGNSWSYVKIPNINVQFGKIVKQVSTGIYLIDGIKVNNGIVTSKLFSFDGKNIEEIYSTPKSLSISSLNGEVYVSIGRQIYKYNYGPLNKGLIMWLDPPAEAGYGGGFLWGRTEKDFFIGSFYGIGHYNGTDFKTLYQSNLRSTGGVFAIGTTVFASFYDDNNRYSVIIKGELIK